MGANELRIGNYFNVPIKEQSPFRIDAFEYASDTFVKVAQHQTINGAEVHPLTWYGKDLTPIPLTEEWLFKFGFLKDLENGIFLNINAYAFLYWQNNRVELLDNDNNFMISHCDYVHQLQNLYFALTAKELTFKSE